MFVWSWLSNPIKADPKTYKTWASIHSFLVKLVMMYTTSLADVTDSRGA